MCFFFASSGDLAERVGGTALRHFCSILQSIQLVVNVGIICLYDTYFLFFVLCLLRPTCRSSGQSLYQVSKGKLCFSVCVVVWAFAGKFSVHRGSGQCDVLTFGLVIAGMIVGQIRSLRNFGVIGSFSVYINLFIIFASMGVVAHSLPNYVVANAADATLGTGPVIVKAFNSQDLVGQVNGMFK